MGYRWIDEQLANRKSVNGKSVNRKSVNRKSLSPLFPFGHGLSYTTFELKGVRADKRTMTADETVTVSVDVSNTGSRSGAEVVQLYVSDLKASVPRPVKELKAFRKVMLQPGETQTVTLTIDRQALSFYDDQASRWTAEPGDFDLLVGTSSADICGKVRLTLK